MQFRVIPSPAPDPTTPPQFLQLPAIIPLPPETVTRPLALIEKMGEGVDKNGDPLEGPVDAHPMHVHEVVFEVVNREGLVLDDNGEVIQPV